MFCYVGIGILQIPAGIWKMYKLLRDPQKRLVTSVVYVNVRMNWQQIHAQ